MLKTAFTYVGILVLLFVVTPSIASFTMGAAPAPVATLEAGDARSLHELDATQILQMDLAQFKQLKGGKLTLKEKLAFKYLQKNLRRDLKKEGKVDLKSYIDDDGKIRFNLGGFLLGLFLGLIGVALAHIFSRSKSFRRSSWQGVGVILIILVLASIL